MSIGNCILAGFIVALIGFGVGCADRPESTGTDFSEAADILNLTQIRMEEANIDINFSDVEDILMLPSLILLDPRELVKLKDDAIQEAIRGFYETLEALGIDSSIPQAPANPLKVIPEISSTDLMFVHLHLARLLILEAVRNLAIGGLGRDGIQGTTDDLFEVVLLERPTHYEFRLLENGSERADQFRQIQNDSNSVPKDLLARFNASERRIIVDAVVLLSGADIRVPAYPDITDIDGQPIEEALPSVDRTLYRRNALFHLEEALHFAEESAPEIATAVLEFTGVIGEDFVIEFVGDLSNWGFEFNKDELVTRIKELIRMAKQ